MAVRRSRLEPSDLDGLPGLRRHARAALLAAQPATVMEALSLRDVGRSTTRHLLKLGLLTDPVDVQNHSLAQRESARRRH
jgi:hypothetical protein